MKTTMDKDWTMDGKADRGINGLLRSCWSQIYKFGGKMPRIYIQTGLVKSVLSLDHSWFTNLN